MFFSITPKGLWFGLLVCWCIGSLLIRVPGRKVMLMTIKQVGNPVGPSRWSPVPVALSGCVAGHDHPQHRLELHRGVGIAWHRSTVQPNTVWASRFQYAATPKAFIMGKKIIYNTSI